MDGEQSGYIAPDIVTAAQTASKHQILTKTIYADGRSKDYDQAKHFNFYQEEVSNLQHLGRLVRRIMVAPRCCLLRARVKDKSRHVRRTFVGPDATLIEQPQHWFALDV